MDDRQAPGNSTDDMHEIEEEANTSTNASPRLSCLTPDRQALADSMMESITASVSKLRSGDPPTIYKVPQRIRQGNEAAYEPKIVSIGPYHNGNKNLQAMEEQKWLYLHSFLSRNTKYKLKHYLKAMSELEDETRSCYYHNIDLHLQVSNEFVKMMVLDACFIVEFFLRFHPREHKLELLRQLREELKQNEEATEKFFFHSNGFEDPKYLTIVMVLYDMLLLENQIPFSILHCIFKMACPIHVPHALAEMALSFFDQLMPRNKEIEIIDSYYHLLHLFHSHLLPTSTNSKEESNLSCNPKIKIVLNEFMKNLLMNLLIIFLPSSNQALLPITIRQMIPCAVDLQLAAVKFKKNEELNSILNVKFSHGVLEIPLLLIDDYSETLFRNLVAFEQCYPKANYHFTTYLVFMNFLVSTSKDAALLHRNGIIDNLLGSDEELVHLFNRLCIGIFYNFEGSYLSDVKDNVQKHCENKWNMWRASLKRNYFTNPWYAISLFPASIALLLTMTQTFFTVFPYYRRGPSS
ncbi:UPF0481 protein At3g47200-like [Magnolia sinica]|uniref:UPF0481 protein At3g47200-like n=1 Tax=Magnolia sinica TaxID=86752 RepID=UPI00265AD902|nr:UPF0481 protein At3g47200-like [Magnolia sinica]